MTSQCGEKMLNMIEWWLCPVMPPEEVEQIARFKKLTEEQKAMLLSANKAKALLYRGCGARQPD